MSRRRTIEVVTHVIFLVITLVAGAYLVANLSWLGLWGIAGIVTALSMLTVYALQWWPRGRERRLQDALGHTAVLLAVVAACVLLLLVLLEGLRQRNVLTIAVVGLFLATFVRILARYMAHLRRRNRPRAMG
jgi:hypothetical protein